MYHDHRLLPAMYSPLSPYVSSGPELTHPRPMPVDFAAPWQNKALARLGDRAEQGIEPRPRNLGQTNDAAPTPFRWATPVVTVTLLGLAAWYLATRDTDGDDFEDDWSDDE